MMRCLIVRLNPRLISRRLLSGKGILSESEQAGGRRKLEIDEEKAGRVAFNRDPIIPPSTAGTFENPIEVNYYNC